MDLAGPMPMTQKAPTPQTPQPSSPDPFTCCLRIWSQQNHRVLAGPRRTRGDLSPLKGERLSAEARLFQNPPGNFPSNPRCLRSRHPGKTYGPWFMFHSPPHSWVEHHPLKISLKTRGLNFSWLSWFF